MIPRVDFIEPDNSSQQEYDWIRALCNIQQCEQRHRVDVMRCEKKTDYGERLCRGIHGKMNFLSEFGRDLLALTAPPTAF